MRTDVRLEAPSYEDCLQSGGVNAIRTKEEELDEGGYFID